VKQGNRGPAQEGSRSESWFAKRKRWRLLLTATAALAAAALLAACGGSSGDDTGGDEGGSGSDVTYGFSHPFAEVPVVGVVKSLVQGDAEAKGWEVLLDESKAGNIQEQTATLETWVTQGVTAISLLPTEPSAYEALAKRANEAGIIWTTYQEEMAEAAGGVTFPSDLSGEITGKATVEWIKANDPDAEVLILGYEGAPSLEDRTDIPERMIEEETDATVVAKQTANEQAKGLQVTEDVLQAHPNISVVVALNDDGGLGAAEAFRKAGDKDPSEVWIVGQDGSEDALSAVKDPNSFFTATAALDLEELASEMVNVTDRAIQKEWQPGDEQEYVVLAPTLIEKGDTALIDEYLGAFKK
jgi:ribose transport system substrate-binding protein